MSERVVHALCKDDCLHESLTKEEIYALIAEATGTTPTGVDSGFISKIKEINEGKTIRIWVGTQAQYNALEKEESNVIYLITDESELDSVVKAIEEITARVTAFEILTDKLAARPEPGKILWKNTVDEDMHTTCTDFSKYSTPGIGKYTVLCITLDDYSNGFLVKKYEEASGFAYFSGNIARVMWADGEPKTYHDTWDLTVNGDKIHSITASTETLVDAIIGIC